MTHEDQNTAAQDVSSTAKTYSAFDPYHSFSVAASAGSGKTYQLAQRFLYLVGAHADPHTILTLTFTKKASAEMRERIMQQAADLMHQTDAQDYFYANMHRFYKARQTQDGFRLPPPRSAKTVGEQILSQSQSLRIGTIDSLFWDWRRRFAHECKASQALPSDALPEWQQTPELITAQDSRKLDDEAFSSWCWHHGEGESTWLKDFLRRHGLLALRQRIDFLAHFSTFIWGMGLERGHDVLLMHIAAQDHLDFAPEHTWQTLEEKFNALASALRPELLAPVQEAIRGRDFYQLLSCALVTKASASVSGRFLRGAKREEHATTIQTIDALLGYLHAHTSKTNLDATAKGLWLAYHQFRQFKETLKKRRNVTEFSDLIQDAYRLMTNPDGAGVRFLIHQGLRHLLLDEFQDTSYLQWRVLDHLANELLAGEGLHSDTANLCLPSIFLVGDTKQSIYGFREADPTLMGGVVSAYQPFGLKTVELDTSYRTAQVVLDFINHIFTETLPLPAFRPHQTAMLADTLTLRIANVGGVRVIQPSGLTNHLMTTTQEEARSLARALSAALTNPHTFPVINKSAGRELLPYRPLKNSDIIILFRAQTHMDEFETALREVGLTSRRDTGEQKFFTLPEISDHMALLKFLAFPHDLHALIVWLKSPMAQVHETNLLAFLAESHAQDPSARQMELLSWLGVYYGHVKSHLDELQHVAYYRSASALLGDIMGRWNTPTLYGRIFAGARGQDAIANLYNLYQKFLNLEQQGHNHITAVLDALLHIDPEESARFGTKSQDDDAITLMTIHKSKGLEFPFVVLADTGTSWEKRDLYWTKAEQGIYYMGTAKEGAPKNDPAYRRILELQDQQLKEESARLFYVALTRAQQYLWISGYQDSELSGGRAADEDPTASETLFDKALQTIKRLPGARMITQQAPPTSDQHTHVWCYEHIPNNIVIPPHKSSEPVEPTHTKPHLLQFNQFEANLTCDLRTDVRTISPAALHSPPTPNRSAAEDTPRHSAAAGIVIHSLLEHWLKKTPANMHDAEKMRQNLRQNGIHLAPAEFDELWQNANQQCSLIKQSKHWQRIGQGATKFLPEFSFVYQRPTMHYGPPFLSCGRVDLLVLKQNQNEAWIIDYKTSTDSAADAESTYSHQLQRYAEALSTFKQWQSLSFRAFVMLTYHDQLLEIPLPAQKFGQTSN